MWLVRQLRLMKNSLVALDRMVHQLFFPFDPLSAICFVRTEVDSIDFEVREFSLPEFGQTACNYIPVPAGKTPVYSLA